MTVGEAGDVPGALHQIVSEREVGGESGSREVTIASRYGKILADLRIGVSFSSVATLRANSKLASMGPALGSRGFLVSRDERNRLLMQDGHGLGARIRPIRNGRDLLYTPRDLYVIDMDGVDTESELSRTYPATAQRMLDYVKPDRVENRDERLRSKWWFFRRSNQDYRRAVDGLDRYIATVETAKHRTFFFVHGSMLVEHGVVGFGISDPYFLGILSSRTHVTWAVAAGGLLEDRPRYNKRICFDPFPFPDPPEAAKARIRELGERLDGHRKEVLEKHKQLTMTGLYNVLEKVRVEEKLTEAEKDVYEAGLVGVLRQIHDDLDAAVADAYGWPTDLSDEGILERLVALNHERAAEEREGRVRWLRPDFQAPKETVAPKKAKQIEAELIVAETAEKKKPLPKSLPDQVAEIRAVLAGLDEAIPAADLARRFSQGRRAEKKVEEVLRTLSLLGQAERTEGGYILAE